ncbi:MAG: hypothetical protein ACOVQA_07845 [Thermoflexibacteraceae bacterium]
MKKTSLVPQIEKKILNKEQELFNKKVQKIQKLKLDVDKQKEYIDYIKMNYAKELHPVITEMIDLDTKLLWNLDKIYHDTTIKITKTERTTIEEFIIYKTVQLIEAGHEEFIALHDKYSDTSYEEVKKMMLEEQADMFKSIANLFGIDVEDEDLDFDDVDRMKENIQRRFEAKNEEMDKRKAEEKAKQKKSKTQIAKEAQKEAAEKQLQQTSRMIYTSLVKQLHPDAEQDEQKKAWKTEMMKKVTEAYEKDDFYTLLQLQLELNIIDEEHLGKLSTEQLKYYNKILNEQINELEREYFAFKDEMNFRDVPWGKYVINTRKQFDYRINREKNELLGVIANSQKQIENLDDKTFFKTFMKEIKRELKALDKRDDFFEAGAW